MQHLILLHGAIGSAGQLQPLAGLLQKDYHIHTINFPGHGGQPMEDIDFSVAGFADHVIHYMDEKSITNAAVFGYSMGGYVGMYMAKKFPGRIDRLVTFATKFYWDETTALEETAMLDADRIGQKVPAYAARLKELHQPGDWKLLLEKTKTLLTNIGSNNPLSANDYPGITTGCLLLLGDRDKMIGLDETLAVYKLLPNGSLGILPGTAHPIEKTDMPLLHFHIRNFVTPINKS